MLLKIVQTGEDTLRQPARALTQRDITSKQVQDLIDYMIDTLRDSTGVGLAAPQVGERLQIIVIEDKKEYLHDVPDDILTAQNRHPVALKIIINPVITDSSHDQALFFEGCLSITGYRGVTPRATSVTVTGLDRYGKTVSYKANGWFARIIQHEVDHLHGVLYVDSMLTKTFIADSYYKKNWAKTSHSALQKYIELSQ